MLSETCFNAEISVTLPEIFEGRRDAQFTETTTRRQISLIFLRFSFKSEAECGPYLIRLN